MDVSAEYRDFYAGGALAGDLAAWLPWLLDGSGPDGDPPVDLGPDVLNLAGGPATRLPAGRAPDRLTVLGPPDWEPAGLPWADGTFSAVVALLVLQHLPDEAGQDRALAEWRRVLRPGGTVVGLVPHDGPHFRRLDPDGRCHPVDPMTFRSRLAAAGLDDPVVRVWSLVGFRGTAPAGPAAGSR